jgi:beta-galactosidase
MIRPHLRILITAAAILSAAALPAQTITIDASAPTPEPGPANYTYVPAEAVSPSGHTLGLNARYLTLDGKPWLPVMGEFHYSRVPASEWETEILKMKSAGVQVIATYLIWIHHEEIEGQWDWSGDKDLRRFVQLCAKHGMYVVPRIGPWSHAEVRNGGFPDWLLAKTTQQRSNDPAYLHYVDLYDQQIAAQLKGLMWDQGGPVIAIQLENEYNRRGPGRGNDHILKLKELARNAGLRVPFYTVTGWDGASIPAGAVLPVYGGYPDAPWDASLNPLPASEVYNFRFGSRVTGDMGAQTSAPRGNAANFTTDTPFMTAEMGGGMQVTYHRRPVVSPDDIAAMMPVMLGSGVNLYGTYMFHGGENPDGKLTTLQESLATHAPNDLPEKTYDFEAPIGEFGDERESLLKLKTWNYFLNDFGPILAPMEPHRPDVLPANALDLTVPRVAARTSGQSGFLFVNNHIRDYAMPARPNFQVTINLPGSKSVTLPSNPITLPADAYFVWPFNLDLSGLHLRYATAQPLAILGTKVAPVYVFFAQPGIHPEFVIDDVPGLKCSLSQESTGDFSRRDGALSIGGLNPDRQRGDSASFILPGGRRITILLLSQQTAQQSWKIASGIHTALIATPQQAYVDGSTITMQDLGSPEFSADLLPQDSAHLVPTDPQLKPGHSGADLTVSVPAGNPPGRELKPELTHAAGDPAPLPPGFKPSSRPRVVAAAPTDADFTRAATWTITIPSALGKESGTTSTTWVRHSYAKRTGGGLNSQSDEAHVSSTPTEQHFLRISYTGDVARLTANKFLLDDNFYDGRPWLVGLTRFAPQLTQSGGKLNLAIYPLRPDPPIFFEPGTTPKPGATLQSVELLTQYTLKLRLTQASK